MQVKMVNSVKLKVRSFFKIYDYSLRVNNYLCVNNTKWDLKKTAHLPLPYANINSYFSFRAKCWLREG